MVNVTDEPRLEATAPSWRSRSRFWLGMGGLAVALLLVQLLRPQQVVQPLVTRVRDAGGLGPLLLGLAYLPAALTGVPLALLTASAGWLFGPVTGFLLALPACTAGSCLAFVVGRRLSGDPLLLARGAGRIAGAARALGTRHGFRAILLLRLLPFTPFSVLNFAIGATPISLRSYALATLLGSIPTCLAFAWAGAWLGGVR
jgi:uncharacterized membrane protein YdjX (TVP38/TMEM64 family)